MHPFLHVDQHWTQSRGVTTGTVVLSELPRGESPVTVATRSVKFVLEGTERYEIDGRSYVVRPGEFLLVDAGVDARAVLPENNVTRGICIYLDATEDAPAQLPVEVDPGISRSFQLSGRTMGFGRMLERVGGRLARERSLGEEAARALIRATAREFDEFQSSLAIELMKIDAAKPATRRDILQRVHRARAWLHDHVSRTVTLAELARVAGMSQFHLARSFAAVLGLPPAQYHLALRMRKAEEALRGGGMSIAEASMVFGFAEASSFSRAFSRVTGITPGQAIRNGRN